MAKGYQMLRASMDRFERKLDELMILMAKRYWVSLPTKLLSTEYFGSSIQQNSPILVTKGEPFQLGHDLIPRTPQVNLQEDFLSEENDEKILEDNEFPLKEGEQS